MNKWVKILLGVAAVFATGVAAVFYFTSGMVETADAFFDAVKPKNFAAARSYLSEDFKASTDEQALNRFLSDSALVDFKQSNWSDRQVGGGRGELNGSITTDSGGVVPLRLTFVKENDVWKIYAIHKPAAGLQTQEAGSPAVPPSAEQVALVKQSMRDFIVSVENKDMAHFRGTVSQLWQKQTTTEELNEAFRSVIDAGANWSVLERFEPELSSEVSVDENGVLQLAGRYPTKPNVHFEQQYIYEGLGWKLLGFRIEAR